MMAPNVKRSVAGRFHSALSKWLAGQNFIVGVPLDDVRMDPAAVQEASGWMGAAAHAAGIPVPAKLLSLFLTTGAPREQVEDALRPYLHHADLVALHVGGNVTVVPVIHADRLAPEEILERLAIFIEESSALGDLGMRFILSSSSPSSVYLYPLLVYSTSRECARVWEAIAEHAWFGHPRISMRAAFIDLETPHIQWGEATGRVYQMLKPLVDRLNSIGHKEFPLNQAVIADLLAKTKAPARGNAACRPDEGTISSGIEPLHWIRLSQPHRVRPAASELCESRPADWCTS